MACALVPVSLIKDTVCHPYFKPRKLKLSEGSDLLKVTQLVVGRVRSEPGSVGLELESFLLGCGLSREARMSGGGRGSQGS